MWLLMRIFFKEKKRPNDPLSLLSRTMWMVQITSVDGLMQEVIKFVSWSQLIIYWFVLSGGIQGWQYFEVSPCFCEKMEWDLHHTSILKYCKEENLTIFMFFWRFRKLYICAGIFFNDFCWWVTRLKSIISWLWCWAPSSCAFFNELLVYCKFFYFLLLVNFYWWYFPVVSQEKPTCRRFSNFVLVG